VRHTVAIAGRELRSYFVSPVAYAVLALWSLIAGFFFVALLGYYADTQMQGAQNPQLLEHLNLHEQIVAPLLQTLWIPLLLLVPALTMGLFAGEKTNGTQELYLTSPITIWELVLGKYLAIVAMVTLLALVLASYIGLLFYYGRPGPELPQTLAALGGFWLVGLSYAAVGACFSAITRSQVIAFVLTFVVLLVLWMLGAVAPDAAAAASGSTPALAAGMKLVAWLSSAEHFEQMVGGLVSTRGLAYFAFMIGAFLILTKTAIESVRWR
jgi:ABC-2 type transport system permease protein